MDDDLDLQLRQLVYAAQNHPQKSAERRKILNKLIAKIQSSGKLKKFVEWRNHHDFPDIYSEAEANTYLEICNKIEDYRPEHPVMAWVNKRFYSRFIDVLRKYENQQHKILSLDELDICNSTSDKPVSKELSRVKNEIKDKFISETEDELEISTTKSFVKNDPEGILQNTYIGEDKNANLQKVILMRLDNKKWEDISQKLGHPISRLSELYQRNIKKRNIIDYFRRYLQ
ncbi:sigma-70 family RNA polymerase sigma factor [Calothrix sp. FACHB-156]|nr:sigma-70 family RNA polymerase sigma factor [Calothrix sp. FACHB-156]